jgi:hypothetical protein
VDIKSSPRCRFEQDDVSHASGSSRSRSRNMAVANALNEQSIAILSFGVLTGGRGSRSTNFFNIPLLSERLIHFVHLNCARRALVQS